MPERVHVERRLEDDRGIQRFTIITFIVIPILIDCKLDFELFGKESTPHCHKTFVTRAVGRYFFFLSVQRESETTSWDKSLEVEKCLGGAAI